VNTSAIAAAIVAGAYAARRDDVADPRCPPTCLMR
jgi:hypothetical protein